MKPFLMFIIAVSLTFTVISCKNDKATVAGETTTAAAEVASPNDSKALEGTGAKDISVTHKLDQTQIVQEGNVAFNFKSLNSLQVYIKSPQNESLNFNDNEVFAIFADKTIKETSFVVEGLDTSGEVPTLQVKTNISTKTVPEYRPSYVITIPKKDVKGIPVIKLDGSVIPVFGMK
ncbi:MAG TPA: hypothetical protein PKD16_07875 [Saprospiraceae bacterium]|nr:hypothetical protein [Saprospiraceae bacterium]HMT70064.1 hypothetical protein [Saprospiraceae bacterium]